ncbi:hypothetical protein R9C00_16440 [Flammeovirgaceae bacterium SG7u.111]|nr:hypothetical protein [Flammeovirgaceae bacterium SG7u.132]WPO33291.1 hypothetical protein R9C00_16440 [Flammeovirgaceae bacterium SG7u.111]
MIKKALLYVAITVAFASIKLVAQPLEKSRLSSEFSVKLFVDFHLDSGSRFLGGFSVKNSEYNGTFLDEALLGYEYQFKGRWSAGFLQRLYRNSRFDTHASQLFLRHGGHIGSLFFDKRLSYEYRYSEQNAEGNPLSLFVSLGKSFQVKGLVFFTALSYELSQFTALESSADQRRINKTRLRYDLVWVSNNGFQAGLYARKETRYFFAQEQYDEEGNLIKSYRKLNLISPQFGVSLRYIFNLDNRKETIFNYID